MCVSYFILFVSQTLPSPEVDEIGDSPTQAVAELSSGDQSSGDERILPVKLRLQATTPSASDSL